MFHHRKLGAIYAERTKMKLLRITLVTFNLVALALGVPFAQSYRSQEHIPQKWLAFVAEREFLDPALTVIHETPDVIVFPDGRIIWRDETLRFNASNNPELWREGQVEKEAFAAFTGAANKGPWFANPPDYKLAGPPGTDLPVTYIGVWLDQRRRVVRCWTPQYNASRPEANAHAKSVAAMYDAILALRPKRSRRYEPDIIRVGFYHPQFCSSAAGEAAQWPIQEKSMAALDRFRYYSGGDVRRIIDVLSRSPHVKIGDETYCAWWAPAIDIPQPPGG
jgi:hypothetical protein